MGAFTPQLVLSFLLLSAVVQATDPPTFVYRMDYRKPADIFARGFEALGDNDSLEDHVSGHSCKTAHGTSTTAFVATTSSKQFAIDWGRDRAFLHPGATEFYVYKMQATENFYSAGASLREASRRTGESKYVSLADHYDYQKEWLAVGGVPTSQIEMADAYSTPDKSGNVVHLHSEMNPNYDRTIRGSGNPRPYIPRGQPSRRRFRLPNFVTACFTGNGGSLSTLNIAKHQNAEAKMSIASLLQTWKNLFQHASRKMY